MKVYLYNDRLYQHSYPQYVFEAVTESEKKKMRQLLRELKRGGKIYYQRSLPDEDSYFKVLYFHFGERNEYLKVRGDNQESKNWLLILHQKIQGHEGARSMFFLRGESPRGGPHRAHFCF